MTNVKRLLIVIVAIFFVFAIKVRYGGQISILLNEPVDFNYSTTNYSDTIFYSLIHENFFYMKKDGAVFSNIFSKFSYDKNKNQVFLEIKKNSSFSNGSPITGKNIHYSLKVFFNRENSVAKKISRSVNKIETKNNRVFITFNYELDNIFQLLSSPELAILSMNENAFSGMLIPDEWERKKYLKLIPNIYYPGGHTYLDRVNVTFDNKSSPDIFLADPGSGFASHIEFKAGIYQNIFLTFPIGDTGKNTRIALYSFLKVFFGKYEFEDINSLTSDKESPVSIKVTQFSMRKIRSILRNSQFKLYINSSLKKYEEELNNFIKRNYLRISLVFIKNTQLREFTESGTLIKFYLTEKLFSSKTPHVDKIKKIIFELTFSRFSEKYLQIVNELDELKYLKNTELLMDRISTVIDILINKEFILPLKQKQFSIYCKDKFQNFYLDYYGRPVFRKIRMK
ncbi:MAG: hypothetical protein KAS21_01330 [Candidatus Aminicenantes bacterium]|nr:hypothetical protein [Candidatus Aminicenantes bacterium]